MKDGSNINSPNFGREILEAYDEALVQGAKTKYVFDTSEFSRPLQLPSCWNQLSTNKVFSEESQRKCLGICLIDNEI